MKSLLSSDIAAQAPSSTMIMKKSFPLLRAIGLSAGLVASAAMMAPAQAATSGSITATGTIPATCSVNGGSITMTPNSTNISMSGISSSLGISSTGSSTTFSLTAPTLTKPAGSTVENGIISGNITIPGKASQQLISTLTTPGSKVIDGNISGGIVFNATINNATATLAPGTYALASTLSCITD